MEARVPFKAEIYRVLIASPSDLAEERRVAAQTVHDWNDQHAGNEGVALLPVLWETHSFPESAVRPQEAVNRQLVDTSDILVGMFWVKLGTSTGVAVSGTVEEIDRFIAASKPAMLYFSGRSIAPDAINLKQLEQLRAFKEETYQRALTSRFTSIDELRYMLSRDLLRQVRVIKGQRRPKSEDGLVRARQVTNMIRRHRREGISLEEYERYNALMNNQPPKQTPPSQPSGPDETGPNGYPVGIDDDGNFVEWIPDEEDPGGVIGMILRRSDKEILEAYEEFHEKVWWNRHQVLKEAIEEGRTVLSPEQQKFFDDSEKYAMAIEEKYGADNLGWDDFEWGMLSGKMSALSWVAGSEWEGSLDT